MQEMNCDRLIVEFDRALRTVMLPAAVRRPVPGETVAESPMSDVERGHAAALMRVNHVGEICAQALYQGQAIASRNPVLQAELASAASEETEHLAWTERRLHELGGRKSLLNPFWYGGALALGALAGACGDRWSLGFLAETERQVGAHLDDHLERLPAQDHKSREIVARMRSDELAHAATAVRLGAVDLPLPIRVAMRAASRIMTGVAYRC